MARAKPIPTPDANSTDEALMAHAVKGNRVALEWLIRRYQSEMHAFLYHFLGNRDLVDEAFQDTWLQIHRSVKDFDPSRRFKPWLLTIAANKARDLLRRNKRRGTLSLSSPVDGGEEGGTRFIDLVETDLPASDEVVDKADLAEAVREAVAQLPDLQREVLVMAYFHHMPYKDIAHALGLPLGTVKSRMHVAVATFAELWKKRTSTTSPT